jgi:sec-independent protein translocase protein TatC
VAANIKREISPEAEQVSPMSKHLNEFRLRIIYCVLYIAAGSIIGLFITDRYLFRWIMSPILDIPGASLQVLGPTEKISAYFKTSFLAGFVIALPFIVHQVWMFLKPGLKPDERRYLLTLIPASTILFLAGAAFVFFVMIPAALKFLIGFNLGVAIRTDITLDNYFSFVLFLLLAGGLVFQIPLVTYFLARLGIVTSKMMASNRKYAILGTIFLAAILTPTGDPFNLFLLAVPIYVLYEISIFVARVAARDSVTRDSGA